MVNVAYHAISTVTKKLAQFLNLKPLTRHALRWPSASMLEKGGICLHWKRMHDGNPQIVSLKIVRKNPLYNKSTCPTNNVGYYNNQLLNNNALIT